MTDREKEMHVLTRRLNQIAHKTPWSIELNSIPEYREAASKLKALKESK